MACCFFAFAAAAGAEGRGAGGKSRVNVSPIGLASTSLRPLFTDMEQLGMAEALQRGLKILSDRVVVPDIPGWLMDLDFTHANATANPWVVGDLVHQLRAAERQLRVRAAGRAPAGSQWELTDPAADVPALPSWAADADEAQKCMVVALGRLALGAAIEAALSEEALDRIAPGARTSTDGDYVSGRLYHDAFLLATWTSSHAQYISYIQSGVEEPPNPGLHSVPNAAAELDLSDLFSRRTCPRLCPKAAMPLLQILMRSTNPGSRGWNTLLDTALQESTAARSVVANAMVIALSGMHPFLHPVLRPPWNLRMRIMRVAQHRLTDSEARAALVATAAPTKEAVRRMLASTVQAVPATQAAFAHVRHPVGLLLSPPMHLPARGMEGAMATFVGAGMALMERQTNVPYAVTVNTWFRQRDTSDDEETSIGWEAPWLGKGTASGMLS